MSPKNRLEVLWICCALASGCEGSEALDGGISGGDASIQDAGFEDAAPIDAQSAETISARFGNFDPNLPAFDVCLRTFAGGGVDVRQEPLLASVAGLEGGVPLDRVTARTDIPLIRRENARAAELFLVAADTTNCRTATAVSSRVFGLFARIHGERNGFVATDPHLSALVRERASCPASTACLHFFNFTTKEAPPGAPGPNLAVELVRGATRAIVLRNIATGEDGPSEPSFPFDTNTGTVEIPLLDNDPLELAVREETSTVAFARVTITDPAEGLFSVWAVGHDDAAGPSARRVILCRDFDPDVDGFGACTRL